MAKESDKDEARAPTAKGSDSPEVPTEASAEVESPPKPKPKPRRRRAKPDAAEQAKKAAAEEEAEADAAETAGEPEQEDASARPRRRGGAAAAGSTRAPVRRRRDPGEPVSVRARARYVRCAPRKARLVIDHIRGKDIDEARAILTHIPRGASKDVLKLLNSAVANAENNHELVADELRVGHAFVDEGPTLKRYRPRAQGRATRIRKRTSHMTIELTAKE